jgi:hypothetical protein
MNGMRFIRLATLLGAALLLQACLPPATTHPVGTTVGLRNDPALTGLWRAKMQNGDSGKRDAYFHFLPRLDGGITVVLVQAGEKPDGDWSVASITTAILGPNHFFNAKLTVTGDKADAEDAMPNTMAMLYRFDGSRRLTLFFMNEDATKAAIQSGVIKGTIEPGQFGDATITADPKSLDAFMATKKAAALFSEKFATLTKIE